METPMLDLIFVAVTIIFFLLAIAYVRGCEKLQ
jgi:succinate-acetate transporter protein